MGYRLIFRIMTGVAVVWLGLQILVLRDSPYPALKSVVNIVFIVTSAILVILLYLNRYRT